MREDRRGENDQHVRMFVSCLSLLIQATPFSLTLQAHCAFQLLSLMLHQHCAFQLTAPAMCLSTEGVDTQAIEREQGWRTVCFGGSSDMYSHPGALDSKAHLPA